MLRCCNDAVRALVIVSVVVSIPEVAPSPEETESNLMGIVI